MGFMSRIFKKGMVLLGLMFFIFITSSTHATEKSTQKILVWGDSLSAAYGIPIEKGWVSLLETKLGDDFEVINGSISGETTQGGLSRLPAALKAHNPNFIILELGANDGLRGIPPQVTKRNLKQMIEQSTQAQAKVMLFGMKIPPNYGVVYSEKFESQFVELANDYQLPFIPFFLEDIIEDLTLFQKDELHPTAEAQSLILEFIFPALENALNGTSHSTLQDAAQGKSQNLLKENTEPKALKNPA